MNKYDIIDYLQKQQPYFYDAFGIHFVGLFGSFSRGDETKESDIDIFVTMKPSLFDIVAIKEQIESDLHTKVDIIREHKNIKPFFLQMIQKEVIYV